jgi:type IV pilus assembly protein PilE
MNNEKGFSLIELMVVLVITSLLMGLAYPIYNESVSSTRRSDAQRVLVMFAEAMGQDYAINGTYAVADGNINDIKLPVSPTIFATQAPLDGSNKYYDLKIQYADKYSFILRAEPINAMAGDGYLELTSNAIKRWNHKGVVQDCWSEQC